MVNHIAVMVVLLMSWLLLARIFNRQSIFRLVLASFHQLYCL